MHLFAFIVSINQTHGLRCRDQTSSSITRRYTVVRTSIVWIQSYEFKSYEFKSYDTNHMNTSKLAPQLTKRMLCGAGIKLALQLTKRMVCGAGIKPYDTRMYHHLSNEDNGSVTIIIKVILAMKCSFVFVNHVRSNRCDNIYSCADTMINGI
eukprot:391717_1